MMGEDVGGLRKSEEVVVVPIGSAKEVGSVRREPMNGDNRGLEEASDTFLRDTAIEDVGGCSEKEIWGWCGGR